MPGPAEGRDPGIHVCHLSKDMDGRDEPGHDGRRESYTVGPDRLLEISSVHVSFATSRRACQHSGMRDAWIYIVTNRPNGILYVGVTSNLKRRVWEHKEGAVEGFTKRYGLKRLVYAERHDDIRYAIQREKTMKHWPRAWKIRLILAQNPQWTDLFDRVG